MPPGALYVGRPTIFGNPYRVGFNRDGLVIRSAARIVGFRPEMVGGGGARHTSHERAVRLTRVQSIACYRADVAVMVADEPDFLASLRGHDLVCWCPLVDADGEPVPCHADVLLELANA